MAFSGAQKTAPAEARVMSLMKIHVLLILYKKKYES